jgi:methionine-rich copper-binding protein CopC
MSGNKMYRKALFIIAGIFFFSTYSLAHSPLKSTSPEDGAMLNDAPKVIQFTFAKPARVVKVVLKHKNDDTFDEVKLDLPNKDMVEELQLSPQFTGSGEYKVEWRALSEDGHAIKGDFSFFVNDG